VAVVVAQEQEVLLNITAVAVAQEDMRVLVEMEVTYFQVLPPALEVPEVAEVAAPTI
jgi:hypothetical protein